MSWKSERLMFQAFLIVSFLAKLCYFQENLALHKKAEYFLKSFKSMDEDRDTMIFCKNGLCRMVADLEAAHIIKTVEIDAFHYCKDEKFVYSIGLQQNKTSAEYRCPNPNEHSVLDFKDSITCDSNEAYRFVVLGFDLKCGVGIREIGVFGNSSSNLALNKEAILYVRSPQIVDGNYETFGGYPDACDLVVDLGTLYTIETVLIATHLYSANKKFVYSIGLKSKETNKEYNCENKTHEFTEIMKINDTITCSSTERYQFVIFSCDRDCVIYFFEIQVFGLSSTTTTIAKTTLTLTNEPPQPTLAKEILPTEPTQRTYSQLNISPTEPKIRINSAIDMKMDWSCYLAILLAVLFGSVSWVHCVLSQLCFLGTNLIGVIVGMQGRKNNEE